MSFVDHRQLPPVHPEATAEQRAEQLVLRRAVAESWPEAQIRDVLASLGLLASTAGGRYDNLGRRTGAA